jgi:hypothetical protein
VVAAAIVIVTIDVVVKGDSGAEVAETMRDHGSRVKMRE